MYKEEIMKNYISLYGKQIINQPDPNVNDYWFMGEEKAREMVEVSKRIKKDIERKYEEELKCKLEKNVFINKINDLCPNCGITFRRECSSCGLLKEIDEISYNKYNYFTIPRCVYKPKDRFYFWVDHILAKENSEEIKDVLKYFHGETNIYTIYDVRRILKRVKRTGLYKNAPLILKLITGISPPFISHNLLHRAEELFMHIIKIRERILSYKVKKIAPLTTSFPFYIYIVFDIILPPSDYESRRIFDYIHLPAQTTLKKRINEWSKIYAIMRDNYSYKCLNKFIY